MTWGRRRVRMRPWKDTPVGRRVFLGLLGFGAAGVLVGSRIDDWQERVIGPIEARDGTGLLSLFPIGRFRIYSVAATSRRVRATRTG